MVRLVKRCIRDLDHASVVILRESEGGGKEEGLALAQRMKNGE
jgi:hypothetical protein